MIQYNAPPYSRGQHRTAPGWGATLLVSAVCVAVLATGSVLAEAAPVVLGFAGGALFARPLRMGLRIVRRGATAMVRAFDQFVPERGWQLGHSSGGE